MASSIRVNHESRRATRIRRFAIAHGDAGVERTSEVARAWHSREEHRSGSVIANRIASGRMNLRDEVAALERVALQEALSLTGGNAARAAKLLGAVGRGASRDPGGTVRAMMRRLT